MNHALLQGPLNLYTAKGHNRYYGLVDETHVAMCKWCNQPPNLLCNFYSKYMIFKYGREPHNTT
jgi:hypothetical protein